MNQFRVPRNRKSSSPALEEGRTSTFTVSVLSKRTGTPVPTIHHYLRLGLLPPPSQLASNRFGYDERHVLALRAIRLLRDRRNLSLEVIREALPDLLSSGVGDAASPHEWDLAIDAYLERSGQNAVAARLVDAAREAFAQHGFAGVNVADICSAAGIAKGSFYRYFDSKESIFLAAAQSTVEAVGEQLDETPEPMNERQATERLQLLLSPMAPLLLEVAIAELRLEPNLAGVIAAIATGLAGRLAPRLVTRGGRARTVARRAVDAALVGLLRPALGPPSTLS